MLKRRLTCAENDSINRQLKVAQERRDPIVEACGKWFFFGAWWADVHGPFESRKEAVEACKAYNDHL